jgi:hypothetical protein
MMFQNIPAEMKQYRQWIVWRFEDTDAPKPTKVPYSPKTHKRVSVQDVQNWGTFEECIEILNQPNSMYAGLGFVLTKDDPYTFIDLDDSNGDTTVGDRQQLIYNEFQSYSEWSPSGIGCHIIIKGWIPSGRRRSKIEIYSDARFMTMTGNVIRNSPINDFNQLINALYDQMGAGSTNAAAMYGDSPQVIEDEAVLDMAATAVNGDKFRDLYGGDWQKHYESQSEADLALINIIAFYTQNREQIVRMFRASSLGKRDKAQRSDYVKYMLGKCFDKMLPPLDMDGLRNRMEAFLAQNIAMLNRSQQNAIEDETVPEEELATAEEVSALLGKRSVYSVPPGLMGEIAQYIYNSAPRQVPEIALAGALGLMAGITGRAYNTNTGSGLNTYTLVLAKTGRGKEAIASGIDNLISEVVKTLPQANEIIGPGDIASAQALLKYMSKGKSSFVSIVGEFGIYLKNMAAENASPHMQMLKRTMLDLYNKSGANKTVRPSIYADSEKNTAILHSPNFSVIGESTPHTFYGALTDDMIREGLLSRFTIIEYEGPRVAGNPDAKNVRPSMYLVDKLAQLCAYCQALNVQNKAIVVQMDSEAQSEMDRFNLYCDDQINNAKTEVEDTLSELWNRAHMKALRISAQVAVGCEMTDPVVNRYMAVWAINIVMEDARNVIARFRSGEIVTSNVEQTKLTKMADTFKYYIESPWPKVCAQAGVNASRLHAERIIPYSFLSRRLLNVACFKNEPRGATTAIKETLRTMVERGDIQEVSRATLASEYDMRAVCYVVVNTSILA